MAATKAGQEELRRHEHDAKKLRGARTLPEKTRGSALGSMIFRLGIVFGVLMFVIVAPVCAAQGTDVDTYKEERSTFQRRASSLRAASSENIKPDVNSDQPRKAHEPLPQCYSSSRTDPSQGRWRQCEDGVKDSPVVEAINFAIFNA